MKKLDTTLVHVDVFLFDDGDPAQTPDTLILEWATKGAGFGMLSFHCEEDGGLTCSSECMGAAFAKRVLDFYLQGKDRREWPEVMRGYDTIEGFVSACYFND